MAVLVKFNSFVEAMAEKAHNLGADTLTIALCNAANAPVAGNTQLSNLTQIAYTNFGARTVTVSASSQTGGTFKLIITDKVLSVSGGAGAPFRYVVVYNDTATNDELCWYYDYGSDLTIPDGGSLTVDFDGTNGAISLT